MFGATYCVLAPEHELVDKITTKEQKEEVDKYKKECATKSELERTELNKDKTKIIMNPNFAIIYQENDDIINIVDLFYNLKAGDMNIDDVVIMKLRLAIEQIKGNKEIDVSNLEENQKSVYNKAINLDKEMDIEKGIKIN